MNPRVILPHKAGGNFTINQCGSCGRIFTSLSAFDAHRAGPDEIDDSWRCRDPETIRTKAGAAVLVRREPRTFRVSGSSEMRKFEVWGAPPLTDEQKARIFGNRKSTDDEDDI